MGKARKLHGDRIAAWTAVFIGHALLGWLLIGLLAIVREASTTDSALDLIWVAAQPGARSIDAARACTLGRTQSSGDDCQAVVSAT